MSVRAKFKCINKVETGDGETRTASLTFSATYGEGKDNKDWSKWTPAGNLTMTITNPAATGKFEEGKEYFLDFTPVEDAAIEAA